MKYTQDLYKAAFLLCCGGKLVETFGSYPKTTFVIKEGGWLYKVKARVGWVRWNEFRNQRTKLKQFSLSGAYQKCKTMKELMRVYKFRKELD